MFTEWKKLAADSKLKHLSVKWDFFFFFLLQRRVSVRPYEELYY